MLNRAMALMLAIMVSITVVGGASAADPTLKSLKFAPGSVLGGTKVNLTVSLTDTAQKGGVKVWLKSEQPDLVRVPDSLVVPAGKKSASVSVATYAVDATTKVAVYAGDEKNEAKTALTLTPLELTGLSVSAKSVVGGETLTGTVKLNGSAIDDVKVEIGIEGDAAKVDGAATIAKGKKSGTFSIYAGNVEKATKVRVIAAGLGDKVFADFTIVPLTVNKVTVSDKSVIGGASLKGTVTLTGTAPEDTKVEISVDNDAAKVDGYAVIAKGKKAGTFEIYTGNVDKATRVRVVAAGLGDKAYADFSIVPLAVSKVTLSDKSVIGGATLTGTVTLTGAAPEDMKVEIAIDGDAAKVEGYAVIAKGKKTGTFTIYTGSVEKITKVRVIAAGAGDKVWADFTIVPLSIKSVTAPKRAVSGKKVIVTVTLSGKAPEGGVKFAVKTSDPEIAGVADTLVIERGSRGQITFKAGMVKEPAKVEITVFDDSGAHTVVVLIVPAD